MKFKGFFKEYWLLTKESLKWMKKYWLAYILLCVVVYLITFMTAWYGPDLWENIKERFSKNKDEEYAEY